MWCGGWGGGRVGWEWAIGMALAGCGSSTVELGGRAVCQRSAKCSCSSLREGFLGLFSHLWGLYFVYSAGREGQT